MTEPAAPSAVIRQALKSSRGAFVCVGLFSGLVNLLMLSGSLYMLQVYDRVLSSRSVATLVGLSLLLLAAYALMGLLDGLRMRMLARIGARFDAQVSPHVFSAVQRLPLRGQRSGQALQPMRDLDRIRSFLSSLGPTALFDMPFMPLFFAACFFLHPWFGAMTLAGGVVIVGLTLLTEVAGRKATSAQMSSGATRQAIAEASCRNAEALTAMGMTKAFQSRWRDANTAFVRDSLAGSDAASGFGSFAKVFRLVLQSAILGLGAYLALSGEVSGGAMIAASILASRALAPIEVAVAHWKSFVAARQGLARLQTLFASPAFADRKRTALRPPQRAISLDNVCIAAPARRETIVQGVSLRLEAGQGLGIIGPSASGKSTLMRALAGIWQPVKGDIRLDGATLDQWDCDDLGQHIGYLPQDIELFDGTVAQNIARFRDDADDAAIIAAAEAAGAHDMIARLEHGYDTQIGEGGAALSGGQRQRIALARALFGEPFLVLLDEPNSNLDREGDEALTAAVEGVRARGGIVVIVTHRQAALAGVEHLAMMADGGLKAFGPKADVLQKVLQQGGVTPARQSNTQHREPHVVATGM